MCWAEKAMVTEIHSCCSLLQAPGLGYLPVPGSLRWVSPLSRPQGGPSVLISSRSSEVLPFDGHRHVVLWDFRGRACAVLVQHVRGPEPSSGCGGDVGTGVHGGSYTATACPAMDPACSMLPSAAPVARWASASSLRHNCSWDHAVSCSVKLRCYRTSVSSVFLLTLWPAPWPRSRSCSGVSGLHEGCRVGAWEPCVEGWNLESHQAWTQHNLIKLRGWGSTGCSCQRERKGREGRDSARVESWEVRQLPWGRWKLWKRWLLLLSVIPAQPRTPEPPLATAASLAF